MLCFEDIEHNLEEIEKRICAACERSGRDRSEVTLIAVSKMNPAEAVINAFRAGQTVFGENKVQELCGKQEIISDKLEWHLIGHLQTNKVKYIIGNVEMIHSVDSERLAQTISSESVKRGIVTKILIEVNIGNEESKYGVKASECESLVRQINRLEGIKVVGLMCVAPVCETPEDSRSFFKEMKELFVDIKSKNYDNISMNVLSMGMSSDFETAIEEGATHVRVGTGIFGERDYSTGK